MATPSTSEIDIFDKQNDDKASALYFISKEWPAPAYNDDPIDLNSFVTYAVSTTPNSSVLIIGKGFRSLFARNTYATDEAEPWLIFQHAELNEALAEHVQKKWNEMAVHPNGNRVEVDKIAAHVLYEKVNGKWNFVPLPQSDDDNVVRYRVNDIEIWSHPPRDQPLMTVLRTNETFSRAEGKLKQCVKALNDIKRNTRIPPERKAQAVQSKLDDINQTFLKIYGFYEKVKPLPNSYKYPTLQMGQRTSTTGDDTEPRRRFPRTFSGGNHANEVHVEFCAPDVQPRGLPTQETVLNNLLPTGEFELRTDKTLGTTSEEDDHCLKEVDLDVKNTVTLSTKK